MLTLDRVEVVQDGFCLRADISVAGGGIIAVIGPSGGGKSTLLSTIAGFVRPDRGRVIWDGQDLSGLAPGERPVSIIFQDNNLFAHLSAFENVALGLRPSLRLRPAEQERVAWALKRVGLDGLGGRKPAALSGGQQSRVALARALLQERPLLLLDEPFAALGPALRAEMLDLVAELARDMGQTILMVTHDPADAVRISQRSIFVNHGLVHDPIPTADLLAAPPAALAAYLGHEKTRP
jgi:thiamine transport system ATP-binding protein